MANQYQPRRRGDDDFRRRLCGDVPGHPRRPCLVGVLAGALSQFESLDVAAVPQPAVVGRLRGQTYGTVSLLFWYMGMVPDLATFRDRSKTNGAEWPTAFWRSAGADRRVTGCGTKKPTRCWPPLRRRWFFRCTRSFRLTSRFRRFPVGTRRSSRRTLWPGRSSAVSRWC